MKKILIVMLPLFVACVFANAERSGTIYTPNGTSVEIILCDDSEELSEQDKLNIITEIETNYPLVNIVGEPTQKYNCHAYAWHMSEGGETCWINDKKYEMFDNVKKYWTDSSFVETTQEKGTKVFYYKSYDLLASPHSAILGRNGKYISKWGNGPLVEHDIDEIPYANLVERTYYVRPSCKYGILDAFYMYDYIPLNTNVSFGNGTFSRNDFTYKWVVETSKGENAIPKGYVNVSNNLNNATISFSKEGMYYIYLEVYDYTNFLVGQFSYEAIVGEYNFLYLENQQTENDSIKITQ